MNLDAYLARIRHDGPLAVDLTTLEALQRAHLLAVPFENLWLCSLATPTGRLTLSGNEWIVSGLDGSRAVTPIADEAAARRLLQEHFDIPS